MRSISVLIGFFLVLSLSLTATAVSISDVDNSWDTKIWSKQGVKDIGFDRSGAVPGALAGERAQRIASQDAKDHGLAAMFNSSTDSL